MTISKLRTMQRTSTNVRLTVAQRGVCVLQLSLLAACATRLDNEPAADRSGARDTGPAQQAAQPPAPLGPPPPGYYRVKPGDTLYRIALENGQNYRDIATWNNLTNPNQIEVAQLLRVAPPGTTPTVATPGVATAPIAGGAVQSAPIAGAPTGGPSSAPGAASATKPPLYGATSNAPGAPATTI